MRAALIAAGAMLAAVGGAGLAQGLGDTSAASQTTASSTTGEATYREICQACHMAQAQGGTGAGGVPALAANPHLADPDFVLERLVKGKGGMPAFAGMLTPEQIAGVAGYVRTHFGNAYPAPVTPEDAKRHGAGAASE
jgi:mono/diheme cytochrome c family protein